MAYFTKTTLRQTVERHLSGMTSEELDAATHAVETDPTEAQKASGNYRKAHVTLYGLLIAIENPKGSLRSGTDKSGKPWSVTMQNHYGYFKGHEGADGDHVDVFIGANLASDIAHIINQIDPETGKFDEHKVILGTRTAEDAQQVYLSNYAPDWQGCGGVATMPIDEFKTWLKDGDKSVPAAGSPTSDAQTDPIWDKLKSTFGSYPTDRDGLTGVYRHSETGQYYANVGDWATPDCMDAVQHVFKGHRIENEYSPKEPEWKQLKRPTADGPQANNDATRANGYCADCDRGFWADDFPAICPRCTGHNVTRLEAVREGVTEGPGAQANADAGPELGYQCVCGQQWTARGSGLPACATCRTVDGVSFQDEMHLTEFAEVLAFDTDYILLTDAKLPDGVLMRVRQTGMFADRINGNDRLYREEVVNDAIDRAMPRVRAGAMLSRYAHPPIAELPGGGTVFADIPNKESARIVDISRVQGDGRVKITREVLNTPDGHRIADAIRKRKPIGLSTRFTVPPGQIDRRTMADGRTVDMPRRMDIHTWDDVDDPAFSEAGRDAVLLTDSMREALGLPSFHVTPQPTGTPDLQTQRIDTAGRNSARGKQGATKMIPEKVQRALNDLYARLNALRTGRANKAQVLEARKALSDEIELAHRGGEAIGDAMAEACKVDAMMAVMGIEDTMIDPYKGGRPGPQGVNGADPNNSGVTGYGSDIERNGVQTMLNRVGNEEYDPAAERLIALSGAGNANKTAPGMDSATMQKLLALAEREERAHADALRREEVQAACDAQRTTTLAGFSTEQQDEILNHMVRPVATCAADVEKFTALHADAVNRMLAAERLRTTGYRGNGAQGNTVHDPASAVNRGSGISVMEGHPIIDEAFKDDKGQSPAYLKAVGEMCLAADDVMRDSTSQGQYDNPDSESTKQRRMINLRRLKPLLAEFARTKSDQAKDLAGWFTMNDALTNGGQRALVDSLMRDTSGQEQAKADAITTANLYNQPSIIMAYLVQKLWDMRWFQFVQGFGPGAYQEGTKAGWASTVLQNGQLGSTFRIPVEYRDYANMSGYAAQPLPHYDPGFLVPEGTGVDAVAYATAWLEFGPALRSAAITLSREGIFSMGNGPLNINAIGRGIFHAANDMSLRIDKAIADEHVNTADEYGAVAISSESPNYTFNSVYAPGGSVVVNLNPAKAAGTAPTGSDASIKYGANVVAGIRFQSAGNGSTAPYFGDGIGPAPIVRPRTKPTLSAAGQVSSVTTFPVTITPGGTAAAAAQGVFDKNSAIAQYAGGPASPNYAIDYQNGVIVFTAGYTGLSNNSGVAQAALSATNTLAYSYATNYDRFQIFNATLSAGLAFEGYLNSLIGQIELTAASMGENPRYVKPDMCWCSEKLSTYIKRATIFYQLNSPKGTELWPSPEFYGTRDDLNFARHNTPWNAGGTRFLLGRNGGGKYAIEEASQVRGPQFPFDANGKPIQRETMMVSERSAIFTPQVQDQSGTILNPLMRSVLVY